MYVFIPFQIGRYISDLHAYKKTAAIDDMRSQTRKITYRREPSTVDSRESDQSMGNKVQI
jgi:hypothetical protein